MSSATGWVCAFCTKDAACYSCPKCNAPYCSLKCYRSADHVNCAEKFYKDCVKEEMNVRLAEDKEGGDGRRGMMRMLQQLNREEEDMAKGDELVDLDSDDDLDLAERLAEVDLDNANSVWQHLTKEERQEFEKLVDTGGIEKLVPAYQPWWENYQGVALVQVVEVEEKEVSEDFPQHKHPTIQPNTPSLKTIFSSDPSPLVKFGLLNVLYAYAYGVKYFYGSHLDDSNLLNFVDLVFSLSSNLANARSSFDSADSALESGASSVNAHPTWAISPQFTRSVKKDVFLIVRGPSKENTDSYLLAALSDLKSAFMKCVKKLKSKTPVAAPQFNDLSCDLPPWKSPAVKLEVLLVKRALKKLEFYLSWASEYSHEYDLLR